MQELEKNPGKIEASKYFCKYDLTDNYTTEIKYEVKDTHKIYNEEKISTNVTFITYNF